MLTNIFSITIKGTLLSLFLSSHAYAYLDPGTGSMILQMAIAGIVSALFTIKMYWYRIKAFVFKLLGKEVEELSLDTSTLPEDEPSKDEVNKG